MHYKLMIGVLAIGALLAIGHGVGMDDFAQSAVAVVMADEPDHTSQTAPLLTVPDNMTAGSNGQVSVPIIYTANGNAISSLAFSIDYDQAALSINGTDGDSDGTPDAVVFTVPPAFAASGSLETADSDGELDIVIFDPAPPLLALTNSTLVTITFSILNPTTLTETIIRFSQNPVASFGSTTGQSVPGVVEGGIVRITAPTALPPAEQPAQSDNLVFLPVVMP